MQRAKRGSTPAWGAALIGLVFLLGGAALASGVGQAASLWQQADNPSSLVSDVTASREGDLVTILIQEESSATQSADTDGEQSTDFRVAPDGGLLSDLLPALGASESDSTSASGSTNRTGTLEARITARVIEVLPNGTLRVEGQQTIQVNGESQSITLSGIIRPEDITSENTVLSTHIADGEINFEGEGVVGDKQAPGLLSRFFNWLF